MDTTFIKGWEEHVASLFALSPCVFFCEDPCNVPWYWFCYLLRENVSLVLATLICKIENQIAPGRCNSNFIFFAFLGFLDQEQPKCSWHKKEMLYNLVNQKIYFFNFCYFVQHPWSTRFWTLWDILRSTVKEWRV